MIQQYRSEIRTSILLKRRSYHKLGHGAGRVEMKDIGRVLKEVRLAQGLEICEVAKRPA